MASSNTVTGTMTPNHSADQPQESTLLSPCTAARVLEIFATELTGCADIELEFSLRLAHGRIQGTGRFACWVNGNNTQDFLCIERLLRRLHAPPLVLSRQQAQQLPVRQALAVSLNDADAGVEFRLYLHQRDAHTRADRCHAWRWRPGEAPRTSRYVFHFMPETASGMLPLEFVCEELRPGFELLLEGPLLRQLSGFWLRYGEAGTVDQLDLALPWHPLAGSLKGLAELLRALDVAEQQ